MPEKGGISAPSASSATSERAEPELAPALPHAQKHSKRWVWVAAIVLLIAGGIAIAITRKAAQTSAQAKAAAPPPPSVAIHTATASKGDIGVYISALGVVTPVYTVYVTSRVPGPSTTSPTAKDRSFRKATCCSKSIPGPIKRRSLRLKGSWRTIRPPSTKRTSTRPLPERLSAQRHRQAAARRSGADGSPIQGTVKNDQGQVDNAKLNLVYCRITSPIDGRVGLRLVDPGNIVQANGTTPLAGDHPAPAHHRYFQRCRRLSCRKFKNISARSGSMEVDAFDRNQKTKIATGSLLTLDNEIDPTTGTVKLRAIRRIRTTRCSPTSL